MDDGDSSTIGSSVDKVEPMDQQNSSTGSCGGGTDAPLNRISSTGADEESENDELTIDDSCVNNEDMDEDNDNNVAIVSSSTLHQMNDEEEEEDACVQSSCTVSEPEAVAVVSKPLHDDEDEPMENDNAIQVDKDASEHSMVSTTTSESIIRNPEVTVSTQIQDNSETSSTQLVQSNSKIKGNEDDDVDIDGVEDASASANTIADPSSPKDGPESPQEESTVKSSSSLKEMVLPEKLEKDTPETIAQDTPVTIVQDTPESPPNLTSTPENDKSLSPSTQQNCQTELITSQENFSQGNNTSLLSLITSSSDDILSQSQPKPSQETKTDNDTMDEDTMDASQQESLEGEGRTRNSPSASEMENDESQQSVIENSEKAPSNGSAPKSRSKSRSRSNTEDGDDVDLEDGEIMDDEEEEVKAAPISSSKDKKEKEKSSSKSSSSSSTKDRPSSSEKEKDRSSRDKDKEKDRDKDKHRKDKKRSKREEEKEKEKESSRKNKKRKASDAAESEQEEYLFVRGASPGSAAPPLPSDPWNTPVEEFGDDSKVSRAKRRRESDEDVTTNHHHHASRPPREPSPVAPRRGMDNRNKRPAREERKEPKSDVICAYFMQGKCQKSAMECSFSHDAVPPRKMELCKFWMMECCAKKEKCLYLHNDFPCKYYHTGLICKAGDRCKFSHSPLSDVTKQVLLKHIETAPKEILGDFPRLNRQGAINLINKMEARLRGEKFDDDKDGFPEINQMEHHGRGQIPPPHERHHGHGHNRNEDRHSRGGREQHHGGHGHGHGHHGHGNQRPNNDIRGGGGRGDDRHHNNNNNNNNNNNRSSRWEQQQPTRDDQEKLHELMQEAGISGFYKDTLDTGIPPVTQHQGPPGPYPPMQPPLLPLNPVLMSQMLPGLLPQSQANTVNNPALANVLASLNIPSTSIVPPTTTLATTLPQMTTGTAPTNNLPPISASQTSDDSNISSDGKTIPDHLPKMQQELFKRIQKQQQKNEKKMQKLDKSEPEEPEENWYSSEDEDDPKKKDDSSKTEISNKISSVLNQIRQQSQPQASSSPALPSSLPLPPVSESKPPSFYGDTDFRSQPPSFKDIDLRNPSSIFKKIDIEPAKEINASLTLLGPMIYRIRKVAGVPKIDYSSVRMGLPASSIVLDPRLGPKRNNSIPAPASPTETSMPDVGIQPLTIPDGTPVFDPRTMRAGGGSSSARAPPGITPQQNNPFLDSDNRFASLPNSGINDYPSLFNRDPRGGSGGDSRGGGTGANQGTQAQMAAMAAAMAAMQQQLPNMQGPGGIDPNLLMLGFPFLPQQPGGVQNPMDFQQMLAAGGPGNMRMRPPFTSQQPPASSWERITQGPPSQGGGDLTPPL